MGTDYISQMKKLMLGEQEKYHSQSQTTSYGRGIKIWQVLKTLGVFLWYEFTEPKNLKDLKCHLVAISINCRHNIPNVIKSHSGAFLATSFHSHDGKYYTVPIYWKRLTPTVYHLALCVDPKGFILSLEIHHAQKSQNKEQLLSFPREQNSNW